LVNGVLNERAFMFFDQVAEGKPDPIFGLTRAFQEDARPNKINLLVGIYKDAELHPWLMSSVKKAKQMIFEEDMTADYLPFEGLSSLTEGIGALVFGETFWKEAQSRIFAAQALGGTGALRIGAEFLAQEVSKKAFISAPTWPNHRGIFERTGFMVDTYAYCASAPEGFDFDAMCSSLEKMPEKSIVLLHAVCHNPTGCDPTLEQWDQISDLIKRKNLLPFFDFAYQGFGEGLEEDAAAVRLFYERGHEMLVGYSCSKNFSLYSQRVGALFVVAQDASAKLRVGSQVKRCIRTLYSNPPAHGARIVAKILHEPDLREKWSQELSIMRQRLQSARKNLVHGFLSKSKKADFGYLKDHKGMFSLVDLDKSQVQTLIDTYALYLIDNGRISLAGLSANNVEEVVERILTVRDL